MYLYFRGPSNYFEFTIVFIFRVVGRSSNYFDVPSRGISLCARGVESGESFSSCLPTLDRLTASFSHRGGVTVVNPRPTISLCFSNSPPPTIVKNEFPRAKTVFLSFFLSSPPPVPEIPDRNLCLDAKKKKKRKEEEEEEHSGMEKDFSDFDTPAKSKITPFIAFVCTKLVETRFFFPLLSPRLGPSSSRARVFAPIRDRPAITVNRPPPPPPHFSGQKISSGRRR